MTQPPPFGLSAAGFRLKRLADIVTDQNEQFIAQFGNINLAPQSVYGQLIGVESKAYADLWENLEEVYNSQYPNTASGVALDNVVALNGITRMPATQTIVFASCTGNEGTGIPQNALARIPNTNELFYAEIGGTITAASADNVSISVVTPVAGQAYSVSLNGAPYTYSLPLITFTGSFVAGNVIVVLLNGVPLTAVNFITDSATTVAAIASRIAAQVSVVASATPTATTISIVPVVGQIVTINAVQISGGISQPTVTLGFNTPANAAAVSAGLVAVINEGTPTWLATDLTGSFTITSLTAQTPFALGVGVGLKLTSLASPVTFLSQIFGPQACPANSLTQIVTPIAGWDAITNPQAGLTGALIETDAQLRIRRLNTLFTGNATVEAIRAKVINVPGVQASSVSVVENTTFTEQPIIITFSAAIVAGQSIVVTSNVPTITVPFDTDQATTMADLVTAFEALPQVLSAVVSGGNLTITVNLNPFTQLVIAQNGVTVTGTGTLPTAVTYGGLPPKSFEVTAIGGTNAAIGEAIWLSKPAGIQSYGNIAVVIIDSQGNNQTVFYTNPVPIYIWVGVTITPDNTGTFPALGLEDVINNIYTYGTTEIPAGVDVYIQRIQSVVFQTPGIASAVIQLAGTISPTASPFFSNTDIDIASNQIVNFALIRIAGTVI